MKWHIPSCFLAVVCIFLSMANLSSCSNSTVVKSVDSANETQSESYRDSIRAAIVAERTLDSIIIANLKIKSNIVVKDKTVVVIKPASLSSQLEYEWEFGEYTDYRRTRASERGEIFLSLKIKLTSKSKYNKYGDGFLPELNLFSIDKINRANFVGDLTWQLYQDTKYPISVLEEIFDYKESEIFICWIVVPFPIEQKYIISVNNGNDSSFIADNVIAIVNRK